MKWKNQRFGFILSYRPSLQEKDKRMRSWMYSLDEVEEPEFGFIELYRPSPQEKDKRMRLVSSKKTIPTAIGTASIWVNPIITNLSDGLLIV